MGVGGQPSGRRATQSSGQRRREGARRTLRGTFQAEPYKAQHPTLFLGWGALWVLAHEDGGADANTRERLLYARCSSRCFTLPPAHNPMKANSSNTK